jgi:glutathione S-transferase
MVRLEQQITSALAWLQAQLARTFLCGERLSVADVTPAVAFT